MRCSLYTLGEDFDIKNLKNSRPKKFEVINYGNIIQIILPEDGEAYIIYGTIIFWNLNRDIELDLLKILKKYIKDPVKDWAKCEDFSFHYGDKDNIKLDNIIIKREDEHLSKIAVGFGLAQSGMLSLFEDKVEKAINKYENVVKTMASHGVIPMSYKDISKKLGELFLVRNQINMKSYILDTPEFIWNYPTYDSLYQQTRNDMDVAIRTNLLNKRLDIMQDLFDILNNQILAAQSGRLELIIIILIAMEILLTLVLHFM